MSGESDRGKLGNFLREVIDWQWDTFCEAEKDRSFSSAEASVFALVRAAADAKLSAIKLAIARIDGQVKTPIKIEYPTAYITFPYAKSKSELPPPASQLPPGEAATDSEPISLLEDGAYPDPVEDQEVLVTLTLRETLKKMADAPRDIPMLIQEQKARVERNEYMGDEKIPMVKSVITANLLILANEKHNFDAITEIFDQIDGKLVETIKILGDLYLTSYALEAPANAYKNKDGVWQIDQPMITDVWAQKLKMKK